MVKFLFVFVTAVLALLKLIVLGILVLIQDLFFIPIQLLKNLGVGIFYAGIPWVALVLTLVWCLIEATVFTFVTTPLVMDTLSNLTGESISETLLKIPLFSFPALSDPGKLRCSFHLDRRAQLKKDWHHH